ncbi:S1 family peptidase [Yoonia sp. 2307UL14-13]|uniref:S1 family peptidase n=1 Tax=Yoonia sp. 2307UL14-13 TaxID=3126506 RepID=UPI0030A87AEF
MPNDRGLIEERIRRKFKWRRFNQITDAIFPITLRRVYEDGCEHEKTSIGTAFYIHSYQHHCGLLVSNYHCFAGRDPISKKSIGSFVPNFVDVEFRYSMPSQEDGFVKIDERTVRFSLLSDDETPLFFDLLEEKEPAYQADLAALPIEIPGSIPDVEGSEVLFEHQAFWSLNLGANLSVGEDCFVVGFPHGLRGDGRLPIWKRASIASEPVNTYNGKLAFLVDTVTRKGMSGSPVVARKLREKRIDHFPVDFEDLFEDRLVGVYSGRVGEGEKGVQLGIVWSIELLELLIASVPKNLAVAKPTFVAPV